MINIIIAAASRAITDRRGVTAAEYAVLATGTLARRKIGGISGDVLGATEQPAPVAPGA